MKFTMFFAALPALLFLFPGAVFSAPLSEAQYLALVMERNNDLAAVSQEIGARLFSARAELSVQRPSLGLSAEASKWLDQERGDQQIDLSLSHRVNLSGTYGLRNGTFSSESRFSGTSTPMRSTNGSPSPRPPTARR